MVEILKNGTPRVTKKSLMEKYGTGKTTVIEQTRAHPIILGQYRRNKKANKDVPLDHEELGAASGIGEPDWDGLLNAVTDLDTGRTDADSYEKAVEALLTALFYPNLDFPQHQHEIHDGRKRIDISYVNSAIGGFFHWLAQHHPSLFVFVECKNYEGNVANPELDQLAGRFSLQRGKFGFLVCRQFDDKDRFLERCRDTARDDRGFIVPLDDEDLRELVALRKADPHRFPRLQMLVDRFSFLVT